MPHDHTPPVAAGHRNRSYFGTRQAVVLLPILVMVSAVLGWLGGLVAWLVVLAVFAFCLRARP